MPIIDSQLHEFGPRLSWDGADERTRHDVMTEILLAWMDSAGIDAAIVNPGSPAWLMRAISQHPGRLAGVFHLPDPEARDVADQVARGLDMPSSLGHRLSFGKLPVDPSGEKGRAKFEAGAYDGLFAACRKHDRVLFCSAYGSVDLVGRAARAYPELRLVIDHMGIAQPPLNEREAQPWNALDQLIPLASRPNVFVKLCGAPVLSDQPYPFRDVWPHLHRILDAFGSRRVMWASDIGRFAGRVGWSNQFEVAHRPYPGKHSYAESLLFIRETDELSESEKRDLLGESVSRLTGWRPTPDSAPGDDH